MQLGFVTMDLMSLWILIEIRIVGENMKYYDIKISNVIIIGDFPYFEDTDKVEICDLGFGEYRGIEIKKRYNASIYNGEIFKNKSNAINKAKTNYSNNIEFSKGIIPFEIVFYLSGIGWQIFTSDTIANEMFVRKKLGFPVPYY